MSWHANQFHARRNRTVPFQQRKLVRDVDRHVILGEIAGLIALVRMLGMLIFPALDDVPCVWIRGHNFIASGPGVSATMVKMQVSIDYDIDFRRVESVMPQAII